MTERPVRILQFGEGNFLRCFIDWMVQRMNDRAGFDGLVRIVQPIGDELTPPSRALNARGGFYEQFMGTHASLTIAEISARGNTVQRELRGGGWTDPEWQAFIDKGWILPGADDKIKKEVSKNVEVDTRISALANGNPLSVELNKPAHMPHLENFFAACRHGEKLNCPAELAYESAVAVLAANVSADAHKTHYFKPEDFKVPPRPAAPAASAAPAKKA